MSTFFLGIIVILLSAGIWWLDARRKDDKARIRALLVENRRGEATIISLNEENTRLETENRALEDLITRGGEFIESNELFGQYLRLFLEGLDLEERPTTMILRGILVFMSADRLVEFQDRVNAIGQEYRFCIAVGMQDIDGHPQVIAEFKYD